VLVAFNFINERTVEKKRKKVVVVCCKWHRSVCWEGQCRPHRRTHSCCCPQQRGAVARTCRLSFLFDGTIKLVTNRHVVVVRTPLYSASLWFDTQSGDTEFYSFFLVV
jgi:hypothetical protein